MSGFLTDIYCAKNSANDEEEDFVKIENDELITNRFLAEFSKFFGYFLLSFLCNCVNSLQLDINELGIVEMPNVAFITHPLRSSLFSIPEVSERLKPDLYSLL